MKVLIDQHGRIWVRDSTPERRYIREALAAHPGGRFVFREEVFPDDTQFERRADGTFSIAADQPPGWEEERDRYRAQTQRREAAELMKTAPTRADPSSLQGHEERLRRLEDLLGAVPSNRPDDEGEGGGAR